MVDYSKWDKFTYDESDEEYSPPNFTRMEPNTRIEIGPEGAKTVKMETETPIIEKTSVKSCSSPGLVNLGNGYEWCQNRYEISLHIFIPEYWKATEVKLEVKDRHFLLKWKDEILVDKTLVHDIIMSDKRGESVLDWEIISDSKKRRVLTLSLQKSSPIPNTVQWWRSVFVGDPEVDISNIPERANASTASFTSAWNEAHTTFLKNISERKKCEV